MKKQPRILITGATGFIGKNLVKRFLERNFEVFALVLPQEKIDKVDKRAKILRGDLTKSTSFELPEGIDYIINSAGVLGGFKIPDSVFVRVNVEGTKNILEKAVKGKVRKFVQVSSAGVAGPLPDGIIADEETPYKPSNIYESTKTESEKLVLQYKNKIDVVIIRPEFIYGPNDLHVLGFFVLINKGFFPVFKNGRSFLHPTYIDDLVDGIELALVKSKSGQKFIICGEKPYRVKDLAREIGKAMGKNTKTPNIPMPIAYIMAFSAENISKITGKKPAFTFAQIKFFTQNRAFTNKKAREELGFKPKFSLAQGVKETIAWYKKEGYL